MRQRALIEAQGRLKARVRAIATETDLMTLPGPSCAGDPPGPKGTPLLLVAVPHLFA